MTFQAPLPQDTAPSADDEAGIDLLELAAVLSLRWKLVAGTALLGGLAAMGFSFLITPTFTAQTVVMPPQQQQSSAASALASLGGLAGMAGLGGIKSPGEQYVSLLRTNAIEDRLIERFKLMDVYKAKIKDDARKRLEKSARVDLGKKDGLLTISVDDTSPQRAADLANAHTEELSRLLSTLAVTEAQQRRVFFERHLEKTRKKLSDAQLQLAQSGLSTNLLRSEPKAAAESLAKLQAEITATEVRLQTLRSYLHDTAPQVQATQAQLGALRSQLSKLEASSTPSGDGHYVERYREVKYQETLLELFTRQYEMARLDESREGPLLQVIDVATPPERKSRPSKAMITLGGLFVSGFLATLYVLLSHFGRQGSLGTRWRELRARLNETH
ncbi:MAG: lipopolysaccharide biosynthesis protein [Burkholderiaceae bacterium]|nr:MAG: lipopolysaccharide biosynthesis protein [Burkholderiaceae bacterium]